jgi:hypothetical protein
MKNPPSGLAARRADLACKLTAYSGATAAVLALAPGASAQIHNITSFDYSGQTGTTTAPSLTIGSNGGALRFTAGVFHGEFLAYGSAFGGNRRVAVYFPGPDMFHGNVAAAGRYTSALKLNAGQLIAGQPFPASIRPWLVEKNGPASGSGGTVNARFMPAGANQSATGYVAFKTNQNGHAYYGWLRVKVEADANDFPHVVTLVAKAGSPGIYGAYESATASGIASFAVGDTAVPEPATVASGLALCALGAAGVREMRRRRTAATA